MANNLATAHGLRGQPRSKAATPKGGQRAEADVALRFGRGPWSGMHAEELLSLEACLVASPELLAKRPMNTLSDLEQHTLLEIRRSPDHWSLITGTGRSARRLSLESYSEALLAACHGLGIAIALLPLVSSWVRDGRLKVALSQHWQAGAIYFVCRPEEREDPALCAFHDWVRAVFQELP